ncbi:3'-5' exonuclease family protein [[Mycoplasma] testudinis]|uniref:hypothetical protein n=1 Tax=[Mycoplasma] testudinis TaxID=33924 RepID=UPI0004821BCF|nr:hypothetical protein [[Mycoplasma] testudinis]
MKYLFFDTESSNCFKGLCKLCEFGYQLYDESFKLIESDDLVISPGQTQDNRFDENIELHDHKFQYAHPRDYYFKQPEFPKFYERIKALASGEDTICFAYGFHNDLIAMEWACKRYRLPYLNFKCFDVQKIYQTYTRSKNTERLIDVFTKLIGYKKTHNLVFHMPEDDAKMTAMIFQEVCILKNKSIQEVLLDSKEFVVFSKPYYLNWFKIHKERQNRSKCSRLYTQACAHDKALLNLPVWQGKRYKVEKSIDYEYQVLNNLLVKIRKIGGIVVSSLENADYCVVSEKDSKTKLKDILKQFQHIRFISKKDLI